MKDRTIIVLQARMESTRLPGKVLKDLNGMPMLEYQINRLKQCKTIDEIIIATTTKNSDDAIENLGNQLQVEVYRGDEQDVLKRYANAIKYKDSKIVIRITGDCPLIDPKIVDKVVNLYFESDAGYVSNVFPPTYPDGLDVEVFSKASLIKAQENCEDSYQREHVTPWLRKNGKFKIRTLKNHEDLSHIRLTVDEPEDLEVIRLVAKEFSNNYSFDLKDIINLFEKKPHLFRLNSHIKRNEGSTMSSGQKLWRRAKKIVPGGNMLLSKRPELFHPKNWPAYFSKSEGVNVFDLDNNKFIDMSVMGVGTNILGYSHPEINKAVLKVVNKGNMSTLNCPEEVYLAEKLIELHPWAEKVRFARTGGEANAIAIRIARAATGRDTVAICGYHGWHDWYLATNLSNISGLDEHLLKGLDPNGVPKCLENTVKAFKYNDYKAIEKLASNNKLAAIKMEVERNIPPNQGFLESIRKLCYEKGIVLIFDECTSGFRETNGGLHKKYAIDPDIAIFGKALGNGYAITSVIGKASVMDAAQKTFISSTFWTERIGPSAALKTLELMEKYKTWEYITTLRKYLRKEWDQLASKNNINIKHFGIPALTGFVFDNDHNLECKTLLTQEMLKRGFLASTSCYLSFCHDRRIIDLYLNNLDEVFGLIEKCIENQNFDNLIEGPLCHNGFKRLN